MRLTPEQLDELHDEYSRDADYPEFREVHNLLDTVDALQSDLEMKRKSYEAMSASEFELRQRVVKLESDLAAARSETLEETAKYIESQSLPDTYSEPCLAEFAAHIRSLDTTHFEIRELEIRIATLDELGRRKAAAVMGWNVIGEYRTDIEQQLESLRGRGKG